MVTIMVLSTRRRRSGYCNKENTRHVSLCRWLALSFTAYLKTKLGAVEEILVHSIDSVENVRMVAGREERIACTLFSNKTRQVEEFLQFVEQLMIATDVLEVRVAVRFGCDAVTVCFAQQQLLTQLVHTCDSDIDE